MNIPYHTIREVKKKREKYVWDVMILLMGLNRDLLKIYETAKKKSRGVCNLNHKRVVKMQ